MKSKLAMLLCVTAGVVVLTAMLVGGGCCGVGISKEEYTKMLNQTEVKHQARHQADDAKIKQLETQLKQDGVELARLRKEVKVWRDFVNWELEQTSLDTQKQHAAVENAKKEIDAKP